MYCYAPGHPLASKNGLVYEHRYVMWQSIGRMFKDDECVHHIDGDRANNNLDNLQLMTNSEHTLLHKKSGDNLINHVCSVCGKSFSLNETASMRRKKRNKDWLMYCGRSCFLSRHQKFDVEPGQLKQLVWTYPTKIVAQMFGVSDKAIEKRCKKFGISKPPRGYWAKVKSA